jgi:dihydrodipicolinate synthase/N-acetylneuraminate lyase
MVSEQTKGVFAISVTPFSEDGEIDYRRVDSLIEFYIQKIVFDPTLVGFKLTEALVDLGLHQNKIRRFATPEHRMII